MLEVGTKAPSFSLPDQDGNVHTLEDYRGKKVVLYFYPKDNTPGCTKQACGFAQLYPQFTEKGAVVLGVSKDTVGSHKKFAEKYGFETVDTTSDGYRLLVISFDGTKPCFAENAKRQAIEHQELTIYYSSQCPYIHQSVELVRKTCEELETPYTLVSVDTLEKAKSLPCVFNNWAVFYRGKFVTVNLLDAAALKRLLKK